MTLPEHELTRHCHHKREIDACETDECQQVLSEMEDDATRARWAHYAETGEDGRLLEIERGALRA
ncbi:hypothetical protein [Nocardiopsis sp. NRRL B-16309]|uniref:hypothetical protein n=1 Tax=Nocardiopsis sp. NRRL B-16309 TaxID=1519494 RepID=UPI0006AF1B9B|nr:hypothetical protein [Nocardiopsis sp. NRRL B-16309]KOX10113.1 hypothetical protein ADL05_25865 [Nocardiopsis sp. NRRL B-16309]